MSLRHTIFSEWTKFWSVRLGGGVAVVIAGMLAPIPTLMWLDGSEPPMFSYHMAHRSFIGDGSVTARVAGHDGAGVGGAAGTMTLPGLPERIEAGLVAAGGVAGPPGCAADRGRPLSTATFDQVSVTAAEAGQSWRSVDVGRLPST